MPGLRPWVRLIIRLGNVALPGSERHPGLAEPLPIDAGGEDECCEFNDISSSDSTGDLERVVSSLVTGGDPAIVGSRTKPPASGLGLGLGLGLGVGLGEAVNREGRIDS